jgi:hypothetical protein
MRPTIIALLATTFTEVASAQRDAFYAAKRQPSYPHVRNSHATVKINETSFRFLSNQTERTSFIWRP